MKSLVCNQILLEEPPCGVGIVTLGGARHWTGTLYFLFRTLVVPSLITISKYHIQNTK